MNILAFSPYGLRSPVYSSLHLLLKYVGSNSADVFQLHCNGAFTVCSRDVLDKSSNGASASGSNSGRTIEHCLRCSSEQRELAKFSSLPIKKITSYLSSEDLSKTRKWVLERDAYTLWNDEWYGLQIAESIKDTFFHMSGEPTPSFANKDHSALIRRISLVAVRMAVAMGRCINRERPDMVFAATSDDVLSRVSNHVVTASLSSLVRFESSPDKKNVFVYRSGDTQPYVLPRKISSLKSAREAVSSWPREMTREFDDILGYLGISESQLGMPLAR